MIEAGALIAKDGEVIHWHLPPGRSGGYLPDSPDLWQVIWENRDRVAGFAHTHPWDGPAHPSSIDLTTFAAIDAALGRSLLWWVVTMNDISVYTATALNESFGQRDYSQTRNDTPTLWVDRLRELSRPETKKE